MLIQKNNMQTILITGTAGFIGYHLTKLMQQKQDIHVVGLDCINDYYDVNLKYDRLKTIGIKKEEIEYNKICKSDKFSNLEFIQLQLEDKDNVLALFDTYKFDYVVNLAAQAGVRYSLTNPYTYVDCNIVGFMNIIEGCRAVKTKHFVFASSSSVYGMNKKQPFSVQDNVDHPISLYAASKKSNELMAHAYSHLYGIPCTGLRFFTVYGPWGRPDMALFLFTKAIIENNTIDVYNHGNMQRDFTYIDDIVNGVSKVIETIPPVDANIDVLHPGTSTAPYRIYNIGNNNPVKLMDFIEAIEKKLGKKAKKNLMPMQPGDVPSSHADVEDLIKDVNYKPDTSIIDGISNFIEWYINYYKVNIK